jgi:hypothetical protein
MAVQKKSRRKYRRHGGGLLSTEAELALALGEERRTIRSWWHSRIIPGVVLGHRTVRFKLDDVLKALSKRTVPAVGKDRNGT